MQERFVVYRIPKDTDPASETVFSQELVFPSI